MKKIILQTVACVALFTPQIFAQEKSVAKTETIAPASTAEIAFDKDVHDYGTIEQGANGVYEFRFKNTGKEPLIISKCQGSCGCTVPSWPQQPIMPGASASIKVSYDTKRVGAFNKTVTISSNAISSNKIISIKGVVNAKPEEETFPGKKPGFGVPLEGK